MLFKDRTHAAEKLFKILMRDPFLKKNRSKVVVVSLLRGGVVLGAYLSKKLTGPHLPLAAVKIPAPGNAELAIGALCFDVTYLERQVLQLLNLSRAEISKQIQFTREKFIDYSSRFNLDESMYKQIRNKVAVLVDDGIATGASIKCAVLYLKTFNPYKLIVASPISSSDFELTGIDGLYILHKDSSFLSVSRFYEVFPQLGDEEVKKYLKT